MQAFLYRYNLIYVLIALLAGSSFIFFQKLQQDDICLKPKALLSLLDIGQGDAIYMQNTDGTNILIDTGPKDAKVLEKIQAVTGCPIASIDMLILTHPDADHIGEASLLVQKGLVKKVLHNGFLDVDQKDESPTENQLEKLVFDKQQIRAGDSFELGMYGIQVLFPEENMYLSSTTLASIQKKKKLDDNQFSLVLKVTVGTSTQEQKTFILTGDAPAKAEDLLVKKYCGVKSYKPTTVSELNSCLLRADVLKLGHHGSKTSTSQLFLQTVSPSEIVISAAKNNSYGHPHKEVMQRVYDQRRKKPLLIRETFREGSIVYRFE